MSDFEREDMELQAIMGDKFQDMSEAKQVSTQPKKAAEKPTQKPTEEKPVDAEWHPVKSRNNLKDCAKSTLIFGGLACLLWYWEISGLMDMSVALPSMLACAGLAGMGIGKAFGGK